MEYTLQQLAELTGSSVRGDRQLLLTGVATLRDAASGQISFVSNPRYRSLLKETKASAVVLSPDLAESYSGNALFNTDPYLTFARLVDLFFPADTAAEFCHPGAVIAENVEVGKNCRIEANTVIDAGVRIGDGVKIGAGTVIGANCTLGQDVVLHPNVTLYPETRVGDRSIIHSGAVLGADGFGFALNRAEEDRSWYKIRQIGNVVIGKDVEIGANTTIDRAALGATRIGDGVKLDNQIQVGHNVEIEAHAIIAGGTVIAGSTRIGKRCQIGGAAAISGHLTITDDVVITGMSMVIQSIDKPGVYSSGIASDENPKWRRNAARFRQLDAMAKQLKKLEQRLNKSDTKI